MPDDEPVTRDPADLALRRVLWWRSPTPDSRSSGLSTDLFAFAMSLEMVAVGWLILDETDRRF